MVYTYTGCQLLGCLTVPAVQTVVFRSGATASVCARCATALAVQGQLR